jgi:FtsP/CotA-like multicopper oxidase with cupredoxin domain
MLFRNLVAVTLFFLSACQSVAVDSQSITGEAATVANDCAFKAVDLEKYGYKPFEEAKVVRSSDGTLSTTLTVSMVERNIAGCQATLRNYNGDLVGPTLRLKPGDTLKIKLDNSLPADGKPASADVNEPHGFNITNFHSHGLHVSPSGNSDNVLIAVQPQTSFDVEIKVPEDHPTGTFWYHAHLHGSTALQVSSGMAGALIIEDESSPTSLDSIPQIKAAVEKVFMLQQIGYDEHGMIEDYDCFGPGPKTSKGCNWSSSLRHTSINGQFVPTIKMKEGEVQRWRFIHGGVRETIDLAISGNNDKPWLLYELAVDGLSLGYINAWDHVELQPGYRSELLVKAPSLDDGFSSQEYLLYDRPSDASVGLRATDERREVLARLIVEPGSKDMPLPCNVFNQRDGCPTLAVTRPHKDIEADELNGIPQNVNFDIGPRICPPDPTMPCFPCNDTPGECKLRFMINNRPFDTRNIRKLSLGTASEWTLGSSVANHPFHIHVNPFQYVRKNPLGKNEIIWRDTLLVRQDVPVKIRSRYERYIGKFVIHCHILDHEDQGMMQIVEVEIPGGSAHH